MMENRGAIMQTSLQALPGRGFAALSKTMAVFSIAAAVVVTIYAVFMVVMGTLSLLSGPVNWTASATMEGTHVTVSPTVEKKLDMTCPELKKMSSGDISKCAWIPTNPAMAGSPPVADADAGSPSRNGFNAAIRPVLWSVPVFILVMGLIEAARCLNALAAGRYFDAVTVRRLRNFAVAGLLYVILTPCMPVIANLVCYLVTWVDILIIRTWPPQHGWTLFMPSYFEANADLFGIKVYSGFLILLYAFTLTMIATVMARASAIVDDHAEII